MALLFEGLRFYVALTEDKTEFEQLIEQNGGVVSDSPERATQVVDCDKLDARHPERISSAFIKDSVASQTLQDPSKYSGKIFTMKKKWRRGKGRERMTYTNEDDARMLHFAKLRGWKPMGTVPESVWRLAENERVTAHSAQSMHERFRKKLKRKTPKEQQTIMTKAAAMIRAQMLEQEDETEEEQEEQKVAASSSLTGFSDAAASESTTLHRITRSADRQRLSTSVSSTIETRLKEIKEEKFSRRTRSRKPMSPLRISQRRQRNESNSHTTSKSTDEDITSPPPTASQVSSVGPAQATPATPVTPGAQSTSPAPPSSTTPVTPKDQSGGRHKRKRDTPSSGATISQQSSPLRQDNDSESVENKEENGIFFRSVWSELVRNHSKRRMLQRFFDPPASAPESQSSSTGPVVSDENGGDGSALDEEDNQVELQATMEQATDEETDAIICQLQIDTNQDMPSVVHALYYCSGNVEVARAFLNGASPSAMWSPQDDLLLENLVSEEDTGQPAIDAALDRGDFATMMVPRDSDAILKRVHFLR